MTGYDDPPLEQTTPPIEEIAKDGAGGEVEVTDPNETPEPIESTPDGRLDETAPPMEENFAVDFSPDESGGKE